MSVLRPSLLAAIAAALLAGCAGSPPATHFHSLLAPPSAATAAPAAATPGPAFRLAVVRVPAQADQPQWIVREPDGALRRLEQQRWAAPLGEELRDALAEQLARRHGLLDLGRLDAAPRSPAQPLFRVSVDVQRFETVPGQQVLQQAVWALRGGDASADAPAASCSRAVARPVPGAGFAALAAAHREALAQLADDIAAAVREAAAGRMPVCPAG